MQELDSTLSSSFEREAPAILLLLQIFEGTTGTLTVVVHPIVDDEYTPCVLVFFPVRVGVVSLYVHHGDHHRQLNFTANNVGVHD